MLLTVQVDSISIRHNDRVIRRMWPRLRTVIFGPTTKRVITTANTIPGMTASS